MNTFQSHMYFLWSVCTYFAQFSVRLLSFLIDLEKILNISDRSWKCVFPFIVCLLTLPTVVFFKFIHLWLYVVQCIFFIFLKMVQIFPGNSLNKTAVICPLKIWKVSSLKLTMFRCFVGYSSRQLSLILLP